MAAWVLCCFLAPSLLPVPLLLAQFHGDWNIVEAREGLEKLRVWRITHADHASIPLSAYGQGTESQACPLNWGGESLC